jgi:hypothetical protein
VNLQEGAQIAVHCGRHFRNRSANRAYGGTLNKILSALLLASALGSAPAFAADADSDAGLFAKGNKQFTVLGGAGSSFDESYFVLGIGAGYYVADGWNVELQLESWMDGDPGIFKVTASTTYVFHQLKRVSPYVGAFYRYTDIEDRDSLNSAGGRAGVYLAMGRSGYAGFGMVYESYMDCNTRLYVSCDTTYPEVSIAFSF